MLRRRNWLSIVTILVVVLLTLLTIQSALSILSAVVALLARFSQALLLFILGLILAYILAPAVNGMQRLVRKRWAAILSVYIGVLLGLAILGALLFAPFVSQGKSLANQLQQPSRSSLRALDSLLADSKAVQSQINRKAAPSGINQDIAGLEKDLANVAASREQLPATSGPLGGGTAQTGSQQRIPPSYITPMRKAIAKLRHDFNAVVPPPLKTRGPMPRSS